MTPDAGWRERENRLVDLLEPAVLTALYFYALVSGVWGLVAGIVAVARCKLEANRRVGKICIILAVVNFALVACLVVAYILIIIFAFGYVAWATAPAGGG